MSPNTPLYPVVNDHSADDTISVIGGPMLFVFILAVACCMLAMLTVVIDGKIDRDPLITDIVPSGKIQAIGPVQPLPLRQEFDIHVRLNDRDAFTYVLQQDIVRNGGQLTNAGNSEKRLYVYNVPTQYLERMGPLSQSNVKSIRKGDDNLSYAEWYNEISSMQPINPKNLVGVSVHIDGVYFEHRVTLWLIKIFLIVGVLSVFGVVVLVMVQRNSHDSMSTEITPYQINEARSYYRGLETGLDVVKNYHYRGEIFILNHCYNYIKVTLGGVTTSGYVGLNLSGIGSSCPYAGTNTAWDVNDQGIMYGSPHFTINEALRGVCNTLVDMRMDGGFDRGRARSDLRLFMENI